MTSSTPESQPNPPSQTAQPVHNRTDHSPDLDDRSLPTYQGTRGLFALLWDFLRFGILPTLAARRHARRVLDEIDRAAEAQARESADGDSTIEVEVPYDGSVKGTTGSTSAELDPNRLDLVIDADIKPAELTKPSVETKLEPTLEPAKPKVSFFTRLRSGMQRSNSLLTEDLRVAGKGLDDETLEDLEMRLVGADVGIATTTKIIAHLNEDKTPATILEKLRKIVADMLRNSDQSLSTTGHTPFVMLMVGVNGVGKTTTIGKLAKKFQQQGQSVMLAAGDTFRAAAVEQLKTWGERNSVPVVAQAEGADSASVIYDAFESAKAKQVDVLIADTAGRLHTQSNLMEELKKIVRVLKKIDPTAPHEVMLVVDGGTGQNALAQAKQFQHAVDVTGVTVTKLDGTAKGGIIVAIADQLNIPIRFIGVGETADDLGEFEADAFAEALVG